MRSAFILKIMNYRYKLQENLDESGDGYNLKTNQELVNVIIDFGCGETEFHTADIERLIKEHRKLIETLKLVTANLKLCGTNLENEFRKEEAIKQSDLAIELYGS